MPGSIIELREKTKLANVTVWRHVTAAMNENTCYISGWRRARNFGPMVAIYVRGKGKNVPRPVFK